MDIQKYRQQLKELKVYCPYSVFDLSYETLKTLDRVTFEKPKYLEYNTDTSALPLIRLE